MAKAASICVVLAGTAVNKNERQVYEKTTTQNRRILCGVPGDRGTGAKFIGSLKLIRNQFIRDQFIRVWFVWLERFLWLFGEPIGLDWRADGSNGASRN